MTNDKVKMKTKTQILQERIESTPRGYLALRRIEDAPAREFRRFERLRQLDYTLARFRYHPLRFQFTKLPLDKI